MCESFAEFPVCLHAVVGGTNFFPSRKKEMKVSEEGRIVEERKKVNEERDNAGKIRVTQRT
jgi:hypothetical protein